MNPDLFIVLGIMACAGTLAVISWRAWSRRCMGRIVPCLGSNEVNIACAQSEDVCCKCRLRRKAWVVKE